MKTYNWPIEQLLPHANNMVLVDKLLEVEPESAVGLVNVRNDGLFSGPIDQVPAWVGIEYMAQTVAAWAGYIALGKGEKVKLGFLLGTRKYESNVRHFTVGTSLHVSITRSFHSAEGLAAFACVIQGKDTLVEARLNVSEINV